MLNNFNWNMTIKIEQRRLKKFFPSSKKNREKMIKIDIYTGVGTG